jgi:hypothetical protein
LTTTGPLANKAPLRAAFLALVSAATFAACGPKPLPNLPPPEYEPGRTLDLTPKPAPAPAAPPAAPALPGAAPSAAPNPPPPPKG